MQAYGQKTRLGVQIYGVVQGVGLRPFIYNLAHRHSLTGFVRNAGGIVELELQGEPAALRLFLRELEEKPPALAIISELISRPLTPSADESGFLIHPSLLVSDSPCRMLAADAATCQNCLHELFDQNDRRFRYPFINCTDCGPRFSIIKSLPYDRKTSTMAEFVFCSNCKNEYEEPANRRFHAEANACFECGPQLRYLQAGIESASQPSAEAAAKACNQASRSEDALLAAVEALRRGSIIAVKGLAGFQLVCDAQNRDAIEKLRSAKNRRRKAFALMIADLEMLEAHCQFSEEEAVAIQEPSRPILLLERLAKSTLPEELAPGTNKLGVMLPSAPLQYLLMRDFCAPLIATSANTRDEPICADNLDAIEKLSGIVQGFLDHDRQIYSRCDDSVLQMHGSKRSLLRRARGLAPLPINYAALTDLSAQAGVSVLAFGADMKNTFCLTRDKNAYLSQHMGNLENPDSNQFYLDSIKRYIELFEAEPELLACDLHPDYFSTRAAQEFAQRRGLNLIEVQHHHAHIVACMVEHGIAAPVIGVAFDGLGYGGDQTIWGGEFLLAELGRSQRLAHLEQVAMPGASQAIRQPWRMALSYALASSSPAFAETIKQNLLAEFGTDSMRMAEQQLKAELNSPLTSSCGRLFDAVSSVLGICHQIDYEGQAAIELESRAWIFLRQFLDPSPLLERDSYPFTLIPPENADIGLPTIISTRKLVEAVFRDLQNGINKDEIAAKFHCSISRLILEVCMFLRNRTGINKVCLAGGVFQNKLLSMLTDKLLSGAGFNCYFPEKIPANDAGIALGQAIVALNQSSQSQSQSSPNQERTNVSCNSRTS